MSHRRSQVLGKHGPGKHQPEHVKEARPTGEVKPVISKTKHGKPVKYYEPETYMPDFSGARRAAKAFLIFLALVLILCIATCGPVVAVETF